MQMRFYMAHSSMPMFTPFIPVVLALWLCPSTGVRGANLRPVRCEIGVSPLSNRLSVRDQWDARQWIADHPEFQCGSPMAKNLRTQKHIFSPSSFSRVPKKFSVVFCLSLSVRHWPLPVRGRLKAESVGAWPRSSCSSATLYRFVRLAVALVAARA